MKRLIIEPDGWPCQFRECPPGPFISDGAICFKTQYEDDAYNEAGEVFWGGVDTKTERNVLPVQPCKYVWIDEEN